MAPVKCPLRGPLLRLYKGRLRRSLSVFYKQNLLDLLYRLRPFLRLLLHRRAFKVFQVSPVAFLYKGGPVIHRSCVGVPGDFLNLFSTIIHFPLWCRVHFVIYPSISMEH